MLHYYILDYTKYIGPAQVKFVYLAEVDPTAKSIKPIVFANNNTIKGKKEDLNDFDLNYDTLKERGYELSTHNLKESIGTFVMMFRDDVNYGGIL